VRFRIEKAYNPAAERSEASRELERKVNSKMTVFVESVFDSYHPVKVALDVLRKKGVKIADHEDFHLQASASGAKFDTHKAEYNRNYIKPMTEAIAGVIKKTGLSMREMENYVMTKHGAERNRTMREDALKEFHKKREESLKELEKDRAESLKEIEKKHREALRDLGRKKRLSEEKAEEREDEIEETAEGRRSRTEETFEAKKERIETEYAEHVKAIREKDYSGVYAIAAEIWAKRKGQKLKENADTAAILADEAFKGERESILREIVSEAEAHMQEAGIDTEAEFWDPIRKATGYSLRRLYDSGILSRATYDDLLRRWKHYVPLRGHDLPTAEDMYSYTRDMGTYFTDGLQQAKGRVSRAKTPFTYVAQMGYSAISHSNRNQLFQTVRRLASKDTTGTFTSSRAWYDAKTGEALEPEYSENPETYRRNQETFEAEMQEKEQEGTVTRRRKHLDLGGMFIEKRDERQHAVPVYVNGELHQVYVNGNPAVSQAINGLNKPVHDAMNKFWNGFNNTARTATRFQAMMATALSPAFAASNFIRDQRFAMTSIFIEEGLVYALRAGANLPVAAQALARWQSGYADRHGRNRQMDKYVYEYMMNGGKTGYSALLSLDRIRKKIDREIMPSKLRAAAGKISPKQLIDGMLAINEYIENLTRFQVYMTSRQMGRSVARSISDAKNVTLNFNQSGTQTPQLTPIYMFINANLQGIYKTAGLYRDHPVGMSIFSLWRAGMGSLFLPALANLTGGDDGEEEYWLLSDYDRQTKTCIFLGWKDRGDGSGEREANWLKIPVSQSFRPFQKIGDIARQWSDGKLTSGDAMLDITGSLLDLLLPPPFNQTMPSVQEFRERKIPAGLGALLTAVTPQIARPLIEVALNRDFRNMPIRNENLDTGEGLGMGQYLPEWKKARTNRRGEPYAPDVIVGLMKAISDFTGGDETDGGKTDLNPDIVNHLMRGVFGGLYSSVVQAADLVMQSSDSNRENDPDWKDWPVITQFFSSTDDSSVIPRWLTNKYFDGLKDLEEYHGRYKNAIGSLGKITVNDKEMSVYDAYMERDREPSAYFRLTEDQKKSVERLNAKFAREEVLKRSYDMLESEAYKGTFKLKKDGKPYANRARNPDGMKHRIANLKNALKNPNVSAKEKRKKEQELAKEYAEFLSWFLAGTKTAKGGY
jgi:hypothetical protein